ncbi:MAG: MAPEG family protein [Pseudomonadota bacterium]
MTIEILALFGCVVVLFISIFAQQIAIDRAYGAKYALSNRDSTPREPSPTVERLTKLVRNHVEGLAVFGSLVLIASVSGISNSATVYASLAIFAARALHALFFAFGITPLRSLAWGFGFLLATPTFLYGLISGSTLPI